MAMNPEEALIIMPMRSLRTGHGPKDGHTHVAYYNEKGMGVTGPGGKDKHLHEVRSWRVLASGTGHTHRLDIFRK